MAEETNILAIIFGVLFVLAAGAYFVFPNTEIQTEIKEVKVPTEVIKEVEVVVEKTVQVANTSLFKDNALEDIAHELRNDEDFLTCGDYEYDRNEVKVTDSKRWTYTWVDDDEYIVTIEAKYSFKTEDERACREWREYEVLYEDGEDPVVTLL